MTKREPKSEHKPKSDREAIEKPYGWILILRGLARAAIELSDHPAALRVLCVASQYMNQDGECRLGQDTIAAHLGITRQAANKHLALLERLDILISDRVKDGILKTYYLDTDELEDGRAGQDRVDERRAAKRAAKRARKGEPVASPKPAPTASAPVENIKADKPAAEARPLRVGDQVHHRKFGLGTVKFAYPDPTSTVVIVAFKDHEKNVAGAFLERVTAAP